jgi:hypothetical protein
MGILRGSAGRATHVQVSHDAIEAAGRRSGALRLQSPGGRQLLRTANNVLD